MSIFYNLHVGMYVNKTLALCLLIFDLFSRPYCLIKKGEVLFVQYLSTNSFCKISRPYVYSLPYVYSGV